MRQQRPLSPVLELLPQASSRQQVLRHLRGVDLLRRHVPVSKTPGRRQARLSQQGCLFRLQIVEIVPPLRLGRRLAVLSSFKR